MSLLNKEREKCEIDEQTFSSYITREQVCSLLEPSLLSLATGLCPIIFLVADLLNKRLYFGIKLIIGIPVSIIFLHKYLSALYTRWLFKKHAFNPIKKCVVIDKRMSIGHDADGTESYSYYAIFKLFDEGDYGNGYTKKKYLHEAEYNCLTIGKIQSALVF